MTKASILSTKSPLPHSLSIGCILFLLLTMGISAIAAAQQIAVIDTARILAEAPQTKRNQVSLDRTFSKRNQELQSTQKKLTKDTKDFESKRMLQSKIQQKRSEETLGERWQIFRKSQETFNHEVNSKKQEMLLEFHKLVRTIVSELAQEEGLELVLEVAVYADEKLDLTNKVLSRLRKL